MPAFERVGEAVDREAGEGDGVLDAGMLQRDLAHRRMTSSVRSSVAASGSWAKPTRYCLSWPGTKPPGTVLEQHAGQAEQHDIDRHHHASCATGCGARRRHRPPSERPKKRLKPRKNQPNTLVHDARQPVLRRVVAAQQQRRERRRQRQRVDRRDHRRDRDGQRELPVELAGQAGDEGERHEHRDEHQRDRDDRAGDLAHRLVGRLARREPLLDVALDILDHDDRVVDDDADRQHEAEQAERVDREAEEIHHREGADDRDRHGDQRDDRGAPGLQEEDDDEHDERDRLEQRVMTALIEARTNWVVS